MLANLRAAPVPPTERTVLEWTFDRDLQGWQPNGHLTAVTVSNGVLACRAVGSDPILELRPLLDLKTSPWQVLELRLKADRDGTAEFFWSGTTAGRYGGFAQEKTTRFHVIGDGAWHTRRLMPFWHPEGRLVRLRFDVYDGAHFEIEAIRILELAMPAQAERAAFDFTRDAQGWQETGEPGARFLLGPPLRFDAARNSFVSLRLSVNRDAAEAAGPTRATLFFATEEKSGWHSFTFPVEADGRDRTYNLDLLDAANWRGRIVALGLGMGRQGRSHLGPVSLALAHPAGTLSPAGGEGRAEGAQPAANTGNTTRTATLRWLEAGEAPQGPPQLIVKSFALEDASPRAGRPVQVSAVIANTGAETATNLQASLEWAGTFVGSPTNRIIDRLGFDEETALGWTIQSDVPGIRLLRVQLTAPHAEPAQAEIRVSFTLRPRVVAAAYVPEPKPVRGPCEVGAYYFPGWRWSSQWHPIQGFPERRPVLGWYREGDPEVADWHIKWAVEHGITFFAYDWYWSQGARQLEHALHDGYFKARYRHLLKFCLLWANHNAPRTSTHADCLAVTRFWIEHYFRRPEHLTIDGKPVMIIFSPHRLTEDLGSAGVKQAFNAMRAECVRAGLQGLHLVACVGDAGQARQAAAEGYDAVTAYNWPHLGKEEEGMYAPFAGLLEGYRRNWAHIAEQSPIPLQPLPVCGGWDSRPWHGENNLVRFGRTPELFRQHLQDARQFLHTRKAKPGTQNLVLVEAWNEWGEGSYIEPHQEFGFGYLDAIREVFTDAPREHMDLAPADVGLGPYDVPPQGLQTAWIFERGDAGWNNTMDLTEVQTAGGSLTARTTGNDPAFFGPPLQARATEFRAVTVRMRLRRGDGMPFKDSAQLFWRTRRLPESEATSVRFEVIGDGQWHDYALPVAANPRWRGLITRLRLDPCNRKDVRVEVAGIRLAR